MSIFNWNITRIAPRKMIIKTHKIISKDLLNQKYTGFMM